MDHTVKTRDILTYHYIEIRYFYYRNEKPREIKAKSGRM